jgi:hypothetical protein
MTHYENIPSLGADEMLKKIGTFFLYLLCVPSFIIVCVAILAEFYNYSMILIGFIRALFSW